MAATPLLSTIAAILRGTVRGHCPELRFSGHEQQKTARDRHRRPGRPGGLRSDLARVATLGLAGEPLTAVRSCPAANVEKFGQNERILGFLLSTIGKVLVEASPHDRIWGIGLRQNDPRAMNPGQWQGTNLLGSALMDVRAELSELAGQQLAFHDRSVSTPPGLFGAPTGATGTSHVPLRTPVATFLPLSRGIKGFDTVAMRSQFSLRLDHPSQTSEPVPRIPHMSLASLLLKPRWPSGVCIHTGKVGSCELVIKGANRVGRDGHLEMVTRLLAISHGQPLHAYSEVRMPFE